MIKDEVIEKHDAAYRDGLSDRLGCDFFLYQELWRKRAPVMATFTFWAIRIFGKKFYSINTEVEHE